MGIPYFISNGVQYSSGQTYQVNGLKVRFDLAKDKIICTLEPINPGNGFEFNRSKVIISGDFTYSNDKLTSGIAKTHSIFNAAKKGQVFEETASSYNMKAGTTLTDPFAPKYTLPQDAVSVNYYYASLANDSIGQGQFKSTATLHDRKSLQGLTDSYLAPDGWWNSPFSTYTITPSKSSINEGETLTTTVETTGVAKDTVVYWKLTGTAADAARFANTSASISNALTGTGTTDANGKFQIVKSILADNKTEGTTQLTVTLYSDPERTKQVGTTGTTTVTVNDTSQSPTYSFITPPTSVNEGANLTLNVASTLAKAGQTIYWKLTGTAADAARFANTSASISNALTGTGTTDANGKFQILKSILADNKTQGATQLTISLFSDAAMTSQVGTTTIGFNDTSTTPAAITKQISPSNLSDLLGRYGDQLSNADTGTSNIQGGGFGTQWAYYINQATASQYGSISAKFDSAFKGVTGKSFQQASAAIDPQLKINGSQVAAIQKLPNGLVLVAGNSRNEGIIYNPKLGKSYLLPSVGTSQEGTKLWALPQVAYNDYLYADYTLPLGVNTQKAYLNSYNTDGSLKWSKAFAAESNFTWIGGGHQVAILPNGNVAIAWQGNSAEKGFGDSTISILRAADGSLITQNTLAGSDYVNLYCSGDGTLWGISRNDYKTPIKILSSATAYNNSKPSDLRGDIGGFTKDGDFITTVAKQNNSFDFTATIIKAADLPYLSTTFGNFSTTTAKDTLTGTSFADTFAFGTAPNYSSNGSASDVVTNFNPTEGDLIKLSKSAFGISSGGLSPTFAQVTKSSDLPAQLGSSTQIVYDQSTGFLYNNLDGTLTNGCGSGGGIFAVLTNRPTLTSSNLQFI